jgi:hypothetical protein
MRIPSPAPAIYPSPWPLVLCLVGVDYFSTLAYLPSMAVEAAGPLAPVAAAFIVLVTFLLALPVYWYVVARAPDGRGATGMLEDLTHGWRGKLVVLLLLGFAAADFVITRSLSLADAAVHLIHNPSGQRLLAQVPAELFHDTFVGAPMQWLLRRLAEPQVAVALGLSVASFIMWLLCRRGLLPRVLFVAVFAVVCYLALAALVIGSGLVYIARRPEIWHSWLDALVAAREPADAASPASHAWSWLGIALWSFPQMALGLSGFEMVMNVVPKVAGGEADQADNPSGRIRNTRKLMSVAAGIMAVYLVSAVVVTTLLIPRAALAPGGAAEHRALAYLAHGLPLQGAAEPVLNPLFGERFGNLFDLSTVLILCLAGASVMLGLRNLLPHYLNRLGMDVVWAGELGVILHVLYAIVLLVTVVFRASPSAQQWAYATSVLVLISGASLAAAKDLGRFARPSVVHGVRIALFAVAGAFFVVMTALTVIINYSGLAIASAFVSAILVSSFISRWIRSTELRFEGFEFVDEEARARWLQLCASGSKTLVPHRPGLGTLGERHDRLLRDYRLDPAAPVIFVEVALGDPSDFYQQPLIDIQRDGPFEVIRVSRCCSVSHTLASLCLEMCAGGGEPPVIIFGWSNESPIAANLNFLFLGEGNIPWMVKALVRKAMPQSARQPRIVIG